MMHTVAIRLITVFTVAIVMVAGKVVAAEALDVAAFFTRQPRPDFAAKSRDWPKGDKPSDVRY